MPFLLSVKPTAEANPEDEPYWYTNNRMGINTISKLFKEVCEKVGLNPLKDKISATSIRKGMVQNGVEADVPGPFLSKMLGQKNIDSKLEYLKTKDVSHKAASLSINRRMSGKSTAAFSFGKIFKKINEQEKVSEGKENKCDESSDSSDDESPQQSSSAFSTVQSPPFQHQQMTPMQPAPYMTMYSGGPTSQPYIPYNSTPMVPQSYGFNTPYTWMQSPPMVPPQSMLAPHQFLAPQSFIAPVSSPSYYPGNVLQPSSAYYANVASPTRVPTESKNGGKGCKNKSFKKKNQNQ